MESEPGISQVAHGPRKWRQYRLYLAVLIGVGLLVWAFPYLRVLPLLWAKPTIKVDYLVECNRVSKPEGYDPNKNAGPYYEKLFAEFKPLPAVLADKWRIWPEDLNSVELEALKAWAPSNEAALVHLAAAARQPYWWYEMKSRDGTPLDWFPPYFREQRPIAWGVVALAKLRASEGQMDRAFALLLDVHALGSRCRGGQLLIEQLVGVAVCKAVHDAMLDILDRRPVPIEVQTSVLQTLGDRLPQPRMPWFSKGEAAFAHSEIQSLFTDDGKGSGRLIPGAFRDYFNRIPRDRKISFLEAIRICARHPDRRSHLQTYDREITTVATLLGRTPWSMHNHGTTYQDELDEITRGDALASIGTGAEARVIELGWRARIEDDATVAVVATLVYRAQKGQLPTSLDQLAASGLIKQVPMDPYSDRPLVCKVAGDTFVLYSVGEDLKDDGGKAVVWGIPLGDHVFWPVRPAK
jgi:hypothetical protein